MSGEGVIAAAPPLPLDAALVIGKGADVAAMLACEIALIAGLSHATDPLGAFNDALDLVAANIAELRLDAGRRLAAATGGIQ